MAKNRHRIILLLALLVGAPSLFFAQTGMGFYESDALTISNGQLLDFATAGGLENPQFSEIDLNGDGVLDLFVFDRKNDLIKTFVFNSLEGDYEYAPQYEKTFPSDLTDFALLRDLNCDGFNDIFTFYQGGFRVYFNQQTSPPIFTIGVNKIQSSYGSFETGAFVLSGDVPAIVDVDGDGDLDLLTFGSISSENSIEWHQNVSIDSFGTCDSIRFIAQTRCWGNVQEDANGATLEAISCRGISPPDNGERGPRHAGSSVLLLDLDNDNDKDLIVGDVGTSSLIAAYNTGDNNAANIDVTTQTTSFPNASNPANINYQVSGYEIDVDHDGTKDLIIAPNNAIDSSFNTEQAWFYRNTNPNGAYSFELANTAFLSDRMLDLGSSSHPKLLDVNGDGNQDLVIGVDFRKSSNISHRARLYTFIKDQSGEFSFHDDDYADLSNYLFWSAAPTFGDMDNDGDADMIIGNSDGTLHYFQNNSLNNIPNFELEEANYMGINTIGAFAAPELADINDDGLLDLIVGERMGILSYFENIGSATNAQFSSTPTISNFGGIDVSQYCCLGYSNPIFVENPTIYGPGKYLFVGSDEKDIEVYKIASNLTETFELADRINVNAGRLAPLLADLDNDGIIELLAGTAEGGIKYLDRQGNYPVQIPELQSWNDLKVYPNPTKDILEIDVGSQQIHKLALFDLAGRMVMSQDFEKTPTQLDISKINEGTYLLLVNDEKCVRVIKW